jgi:hypothetical protein
MRGGDGREGEIEVGGPGCRGPRYPRKLEEMKTDEVHPKKGELIGGFQQIGFLINESGGLWLTLYKTLG